MEIESEFFRIGQRREKISLAMIGKVSSRKRFEDIFNLIAKSSGTIRHTDAVEKKWYSHLCQVRIAGLQHFPETKMRKRRQLSSIDLKSTIFEC